MADHSEAEIIWEGEAPSAEIIAKVRDAIRDEMDDLDEPDDLVFHTMLLTDDWNGPIVTLSGNGAGFMAEYSADANWAPIAEIPD